VLDYCELVEDFSEVHFEHASVDFVRSFYLQNKGEKTKEVKGGRSLTDDMSLSMGESHWREAVFICISEIASTVLNGEGERRTELMKVIKAK